MSTGILLTAKGCGGYLDSCMTKAGVQDKDKVSKRILIGAALFDLTVTITCLVVGILGKLSLIAMPAAAAYALIGIGCAFVLITVGAMIKEACHRRALRKDEANQVKDFKKLTINEPVKKTLSIRIKDEANQVKEFKKLPQPEASKYFKECDRFNDAIPTDSARIYLDNGATPTNGALVWDGNIQIQGPATYAHSELMWNLVAEKGIKAIIRIGKDEVIGGSCVPYTPSLRKGSTSSAAILEQDSSHSIKFTKGDIQTINPSITCSQYQHRHPKRIETVTVFAFDGWPDHGLCTHEEMLTLIKEVDKIGGPIMAHCKGGVGRSGTFLMCLKIYQLCKAQSKEVELDPVALVKELRQNRNSAVELKQFKWTLQFIKYLQQNIG